MNKCSQLVLVGQIMLNLLAQEEKRECPCVLWHCQAWKAMSGKPYRQIEIKWNGRWGLPYIYIRIIYKCKVQFTCSLVNGRFQVVGSTTMTSFQSHLYIRNTCAGKVFGLSSRIVASEKEGGRLLPPKIPFCGKLAIIAGITSFRWRDNQQSMHLNKFTVSVKMDNMQVVASHKEQKNGGLLAHTLMTLFSILLESSLAIQI